MQPPVVIWTDHTYRLVLSAGDTPAQNVYDLEVKAGDKDAMGKAKWAAYPSQSVAWSLFTEILQSASFPPPVLYPDEMY